MTGSDEGRGCRTGVRGRKSEQERDGVHARGCPLSEETREVEEGKRGGGARLPTTNETETCTKTTNPPLRTKQQNMQNLRYSLSIPLPFFSTLSTETIAPRLPAPPLLPLLCLLAIAPSLCTTVVSTASSDQTAANRGTFSRSSFPLSDLLFGKDTLKLCVLSTREPEQSKRMGRLGVETGGKAVNRGWKGAATATFPTRLC